MKKIFKLLFLILVIFLVTLFIFVRSKDTELDKMTTDEIKEYFYKNKKSLKKIIDFCEEYPSLHIVNKSTFKLYEQNKSKEENKAISDIQNIISSVKVDSVECSRLKEVLNNNLLGVSFSLYSAGLGVSGEGQLIEYETIRNQENCKKKKQVDIPWETKIPLENGWSIVYVK